jgi:hypothetical protein
MSVKLKSTQFRNISKVILVKTMTFYNLFKYNKITIVKILQSFHNRLFNQSHQPPWAGASALLSIVFILSILVSGCEPTTQVVGLATGISAKTLDLLWVFESEEHRQIEIQVIPRDLSADKTMICFIKGESGSNTHFRLYDDGGLGTWNDSDGWADSKSGDIIPGDGIFSRRINSKFAPRRGDYNLSFVFTTGPPPDSLHVKVSVSENSPPAVIRHETPPFVASGSISDTFTAIIGDPDGFSDVNRTELVLTEPELEISGFRTYPMERMDDSTWTIVSFPEMAVGIHDRPYQVVYRTLDNVLSQGQVPQWVYSDRIACQFENLPPEIVNFSGPDTVWIPREDTTTVFFHFDIEVRDDQGVNDFDSLFVFLPREGRDPWQSFYFDDGVDIDSTAGDGFYRAGFSANRTNPTDVTFTFNWTPSDRAGNSGETLSTDLVFAYDDEQFINRKNNPDNPSGYIPFSSINKGYFQK